MNRYFVWLIRGCAASLAASAMAGAVNVEKPPVVLIVIESLRRDHVGSYGYPKPTTPGLDAFARDGVRYDDAIALSSWTLPSVMSLITSMEPLRHQVRIPYQKLDDKITTWAEQMKTAGYETAAFVPSSTLSAEFGFERGFDLYDEYSIPILAGINGAGVVGKTAGMGLKETSKATTESVVRWIKGRKKPEKPFFLYVHYFDPHYDYEPPIEYRRMFTDPDYHGKQNGTRIWYMQNQPVGGEDQREIVGLYDGEIRYADDQVAVFLDELKNNGLYDQSVIIVTADHGEEFWDHGSVTHGHTLYEELIRVPLIVKWPGGEGAGTVIAGQVSHLDLMPTVLRRTGRKVPGQCQGMDLLSHQRQEQVLSLDTRNTEAWGAARGGGLKGICHGLSGKRWYYDLAADPHERKVHGELAGEETNRFAEIKRKLDEWEKTFNGGKQATGNKIDISPELDRQLRSLGYVH